MSPDEILNKEELELNLRRLPGWRYEGDSLRTTLHCADVQTAVDLLAAIADLAQAADHYPDVSWHYTALQVALPTRDGGDKVTQQDAALGQQISQAAREHCAEIG